MFSRFSAVASLVPGRDLTFLSRDHKGAVILILVALLLVACKSKPPEAAARIAVLRFENVGPEASRNWMGRAFSEAIAASFTGVPGRYPISLQTMRSVSGVLGPQQAADAGLAAERPAAIALGANRIVYGQYNAEGGRVRADAMVEDLTSGRILRSASASSPDVASAANALARRLGATAPAPTQSAAVWHAWSDALEQPDPALALRGFEKAISLDPAFGPAWLAAVETAARLNDRAAAHRLLEEAAKRAALMRPVDRARLQLQQAGLSGDPAATRRALEALAAADPADPVPPSTLANFAERDHDYRRAAALLRTAASLAPEDIVLANRLGYAEAWSGNLDAALASLARYAAMRPGEANPLDSIGDVYFYCGRPADAERAYLTAFKKNPQFNGGAAGFKAAFARLFTGDKTGAGRLFDEFLASRPGDPIREYRRAEWLWLSGRKQDAVRALDAFAASTEAAGARELAARAHGHLGFWRLELGDASAARAETDKAARLAPPGNAGLADVLRFLAVPAGSAPEWAVRAERELSSPQAVAAKPLVLAVALLRSGDYSGAVPGLKDLYARWTPTAGDPTVPVLLAWAYAETGQTAQAAPLIAPNPMVQAGGLDPFISLWFPRIFAVRAKVWAQQGRAADARASEALYRLFP